MSSIGRSFEPPGDNSHIVDPDLIQMGIVRITTRKS
jgi:hypothetical protein